MANFEMSCDAFNKDIYTELLGNAFSQDGLTENLISLSAKHLNT